MLSSFTSEELEGASENKPEEDGSMRDPDYSRNGYGSIEYDR